MPATSSQKRTSWPIAFFKIVFCLTCGYSAATADELRHFEQKIRPILVEHCFECHSSDADEVMGGLVLDDPAALRSGGDTGPAIAERDPNRSLLYQAISYRDRDLQMPPSGPLPAEVIADFKTWIETGAFDPRESSAKSRKRTAFDLGKRKQEHWSWQRPSPSPTNAGIDSFVDAAITREGLRPAPPASSANLLRRLSFDLIGLPPSVSELDTFADEAQSDFSAAYDRVVTRLLNDPKFGEHWARHWLDVVRYSETKGHVTDQERPFAWKYRDYVIRAFNADRPYDEFVREHVAGDLIPRQSPDDAATATGVLFMHEMHFMAVDPVKQRWDEINAQVDVVTKAFLGLTVECARCHDHKFDAISQADYYAFAGFFLSTEQGTSRVGPRAENISEAAIAAERAYESFLKNKIASRRKAQSPKAGSEYFPISPELGIQSPSDTKKLIALMQNVESADPSWADWVRSAKDADARDAPLLIRGDVHKTADTVPRRTLTAFGGQLVPEDIRSKSSGRLWLADQLADSQNPLTARVWVNRLWHHLFGKGIVATPNNFGAKGIPPTHPPLLDYLANRLVAENWSTKELIREIVRSEAYRRSTTTDPKNETLDPTNKWLSHQNVRRLTAEQLRDALLRVTGSLDETMFGPSIDCFVPPYATANKPSNVPTSGPIDGDKRRSIYIKVRRNFFDPFMQKFDFPTPSKSIGKRDVTNVPSQSLAMLNSPLVHKLASEWSTRLIGPDSLTGGSSTGGSSTGGFATGGSSTGDSNNKEATITDVQSHRIHHMWQCSIGRSPTESEEATIKKYIAVRLAEETKQATSGASEKASSALQRRHELWKDVAHILFNHPDFAWIR